MVLFMVLGRARPRIEGCILVFGIFLALGLLLGRGALKPYTYTPNMLGKICNVGLIAVK